MNPLATQYPHVAVRLRLSDHLLDLLREGVDVAVRLAVMRDSSLVMHKIADCPRLLCAAPAYLERRGRPERPALNDQSLLEYSRSFTGNRKDLARQLGMSERTLYRRLKALEG